MSDVLKPVPLVSTAARILSEPPATLLVINPVSYVVRQFVLVVAYLTLSRIRVNFTDKFSGMLDQALTQ